MKRSHWLPFLSLLIAACGKGNFSSRAGQTQGGVLRYALNSPTTTLDPGKVQDVDYSDLIQNIFEGLVAYDENNRLMPKLAEKWEVKDGGRTFVFTLRKGVKFSNGRALEASDFKWTMERNLGKTLSSPVAHDYLENIVGVDDFIAGKAKEVTGIRVVDPGTLSITIDKPRPYFLGNLAYPCAFAMAKEVAGMGEISTPEQAIGTGPFKLERVSPDQEIDLVAFDGYYLGKPKVQRIVRPIVKDASTRLNQFKNGELAYLAIYRQDVPAVKADPELAKDLVLQQRPAVYYLSLNENTYPPFKDPRVRRAVAMAVNRPHLVNDLLGIYEEAKGFLPPGVPGYRPGYSGVPYDVAAAKKMLAEAGYPGGKGLEPVELMYRESTPDSRIASEAIQQALTQNLGIPVVAKAYDWGTLLALRNKGKHQMAFLSWYADYLDPQNFLSFLLSSTSAQNRDGYANPQFDRLCAEADVEQDAAKRMAMYQEAEDLVVNDAGRIPLYFQKDPVLISPKVKNLRSNLFGQLPHLTTQVE